MTSNPFDTRRKTDDAGGNTRPIVRTSQSYTQDICDTYNRAMSTEDKRRGLEWFVDGNGEPKLGFSQQFSTEQTKRMKSADEAERKRWMHFHRNPINPA